MVSASGHDEGVSEPKAKKTTGIMLPVQCCPSFVSSNGCLLAVSHKRLVWRFNKQGGVHVVR